MIRLTSPRRFFSAFALIVVGSAVWGIPTSLAAQGSKHGPVIASVVIDADSGAVLHATAANRRVRPASLTKLMTALLVLRHFAADQQAATHKWAVSNRAAAQPPSRLGLRSGNAIVASTVLDAVLVPSANDAAVVAAEAIAGDEASFVRLMNDTAAQLGMSRTRFANASGLPAAQLTTARDMAILARHLWQAFPAQRKRFAQTGMQFAGRWRGSTNPLLGSYRGARGMKTGFTCRAGFHLVGVANRKGRTLIAVVLGARQRDSRSRNIRTLLDRAFATRSPATTLNLATLRDATDQASAMPASTSIIAGPCLVAKGPSGWNIDIGVRRSAKEARKLARQFIRARRRILRGGRATSIPRYIGVDLHRAIVTGLKQDRARDACLDFRKTGGSCIIFGADIASAQLEEAARIRTLAAAYRAAAPK